MSTGLPVPPGFGALEAFDGQRHRGLGICRERAARFGADLNACYLTATEFFRALHHFPIVFSRVGSEAGYVPVAVFGMTGGQNLFVDDAGAWEEGVYRPAYLRAYPFHTLDLAPAAETAEPRSLVCVDPGGLCADEPALVDARGTPSAEWEDRQDFLRDLDTARRQTRVLTDSLAQFELLEPVEAHAHTADRGTLRLAGIHRVSEQRLSALPAEALATLMERGLLSRIYGHLISLDNFAALLDRSAQVS